MHSQIKISAGFDCIVMTNSVCKSVDLVDSTNLFFLPSLVDFCQTNLTQRCLIIDSLCFVLPLLVSAAKFIVYLLFIKTS